MIAGTSLESAVGLTQILAETGKNLLGMRVDLNESRRLTRRIAAAARRGDDRAVRRLEAARRRVDERFDPAKSLAATVRLHWSRVLCFLCPIRTLLLLCKITPPC